MRHVVQRLQPVKVHCVRWPLRHREQELRCEPKRGGHDGDQLRSGGKAGRGAVLVIH